MPPHEDALSQTGNGGWRNETEKFEKIDGKIHVRTLSKSTDDSGRVGMNSIFGEKVMGIRKADIAAQFQYGFPESAADSDIANGGSISIVESLLTLSTGTDAAGYASIKNRKSLRYIPGHEAYINFTAVFSQGVADSYQRAGLFDDNNGFFIGYEGENFSVTRRRNGVDSTIPIDITEVFPDGTFNPTFGNVYKISFGYLGFATISFEVMQPNGQWIEFAKIEYPNSSGSTHITNTNLPPRAEVSNSGNTSDLVLKSASFTAGIVNGGGSDPASRKFTYSRTQVSIVPTEQMIVTFRAKDTYNSITNYIQSIFTFLGPSTDLSKNSLWEIRKNMTITGTPTWNNIGTDSTIEYSTNAVTTSGTGIVEFAYSMQKTDRLFEDIENQEIEMFPGDTLSIIIKTPLGTSGTFDFTTKWKELF